MEGKKNPNYYHQNSNSYQNYYYNNSNSNGGNSSAGNSGNTHANHNGANWINNNINSNNNYNAASNNFKNTHYQNPAVYGSGRQLNESHSNNGNYYNPNSNNPNNSNHLESFNRTRPAPDASSSMDTNDETAVLLRQPQQHPHYSQKPQQEEAEEIERSEDPDAQQQQQQQQQQQHPDPAQAEEEEEQVSQEPAEDQELERSWTFWKERHSQIWSEENLQKVGPTFSTIFEFWKANNLVPQINPEFALTKTNLHLFKDSSKPVWESNLEGGQLTFQVSNKEV